MGTQFHSNPMIDPPEICQAVSVFVDAEEKRWLGAIARSDDRQAFEALYRRYHPRLLRFCHRLNGQLESLEEIVNDTMLVIWRKASSYDPTCRPSTWIFGIAYRKTLENLRRRRRHNRFESLDSHPGLHQPSPSSVHETADWLHTAFMELSEEHRSVVELTYYYGMSYKEIAQVVGCPENTVKTRMFHARKKLQSILPRLAEPAPGVDHDEID